MMSKSYLNFLDYNFIEMKSLRWTWRWEDVSLAKNLGNWRPGISNLIQNNSRLTTDITKFQSLTLNNNSCMIHHIVQVYRDYHKTDENLFESLRFIIFVIL